MSECGGKDFLSTEDAEFAVRLFGYGFLYASHHGRIYPFSEADKLSWDSAFPSYKGYRNYKNYRQSYMKSVGEATVAFRQWQSSRTNCSDEPHDERKPPPYKRVKVNVPLGDTEINRPQL